MLWKHFGGQGGLGDAGPGMLTKEPKLFGQPYKKNIRLGRGAGGMSGTASKGSLDKILLDFESGMHSHRDWEMVDLGAGSGVVVAMSFTYGASLAVGVELKNEGQGGVFSASMAKILPFGVDPSRALLQYGADIRNCTSLPTLQTPESKQMRKGVFAFCDGFSEVDRGHMFGLIGRDVLVHMFMCSCGRGKQDRYGTPEDVLEALNASATDARIPLFAVRSNTPCFKVKMFGGGGQKTLHVFMRRISYRMA